MFSNLLFIFLQFLIISSQEFNEKDIPVVEGDGGDVKITVEEDVYVLTEDNFDLIVLSKPIILVEFYALWCGHCKQLAPEYSKAAKILKSEGIPLAKVDANKEESLAKRFQVTGFPTLFVFKNGTKEEYSGPRTALGIVDWMRERADPNWKPPEEVVISLKEENFDEIVSKEELIVVEFYAPWCGHCKQLEPEYERAAKRLEPKIKLTKINAIEEKALSERFQVSGYPTILLFRYGKKYPYKGPRDENGIVGYLQQQLIFPTKVLTTSESLLKSLRSDWPTIVGLFESKKHPFFQIFVDTAYDQREHNYRFYHSFDSKLISDLKEKTNSILLFSPELFTSKYEPNRYRLPFDSSLTVENVKYFIGNNSVQLVGQRSGSSQWLYSNKYPLLVVYYEVDLSFEHKKQTQITRRQVLEVAKDYRQRITFCISNEEDYLEELKDLKLDDSGEDVNVGFFASNKVRYSMEPTDEFNAEVLKKFVEDVLNGRIKRTIRSQLKARNDGPVLAVVGDTFEELVTNSDKHVLIEFYAQWCGHCKKLEPIYRQLAEKFSQRKDLIIAKMDATANDYPEMFEVNGFPTIYLLRKDQKNDPKPYSGDRSLEDLSKFLESNLGDIKEEL